jgi:putative transposase
VRSGTGIPAKYWATASPNIGADMVTAAIEGAVATHGGRCRGTILHSGRGGEYAAHLTAEAGFRHGHEEYYRHVYATKAELVAAVDNWINFYNITRRHSAIGMQSPDDFEKSLHATA